MAEASSSLYNVEQVLNFMEEDPDDVFDEVFFPGSDDKLGHHWGWHRWEW